MQIRHFRRFRQNGPFLAGDKTRFTKNTVCATPNLSYLPESSQTPISLVWFAGTTSDQSSPRERGCDLPRLTKNPLNRWPKLFLLQSLQVLVHRVKSAERVGIKTPHWQDLAAAEFLGSEEFSGKAKL